MTVACCESGLALLGGEMAEMPGFYNSNEYDVAGFIIGVVDRDKVLGPKRVVAGQKLLGLASSGLHTNGYSLARKIIFEEKGLTHSDKIPGMDVTVGEALLAIHRPYFKIVEGLLAEDKIAAMAHITGGGFLDNIPRVLPEGLDARVDRKSWEIPPLFRYFVEEGNVEEQEAFRVFNMGVGLVLMVNPEDEEYVAAALRAQGEAVFHLGETLPGDRKVILD